MCAVSKPRPDLQFAWAQEGLCLQTLPVPQVWSHQGATADHGSPGFCSEITFVMLLAFARSFTRVIFPG